MQTQGPYGYESERTCRDVGSVVRGSVDPIPLCTRRRVQRSGGQTPSCWHDLLVKVGTGGDTPRSFSGYAVHIGDVESQCVLYLSGSKLRVVALLLPICHCVQRDGCRLPDAVRNLPVSYRQKNKAKLYEHKKAYLARNREKLRKCHFPNDAIATPRRWQGFSTKGHQLLSLRRAMSKRWPHTGSGITIPFTERVLWRSMCILGIAYSLRRQLAHRATCA